MLNTTVANFLKFLLFLGLGVFILYLVYQNQNTAYLEDCTLKGIPAADCSLMQKVIDDFARADYGWIALVLLAFIISNISRAIRWRMLIQPLGYQVRLINAFLTIVIGYFANLGLPRLGEIVRPGLLSRYEKIPLEKTMGTVVADRIFDVISILLVTGLAFLLEYDRLWALFSKYAGLSDKLDGWSQPLLLVLLFLVVIVALVWRFRRRIARTGLYAKLRELVVGFMQGLQTVRQLDRPFWFIFHSVNIWVMYFLMTYLCFFAFEPTSHLPPAAGLLVFVFGAWGIVIPSPGGMGSYHFLAQLALSMYGISGEDGFSWAMLAFVSIQLGCNILIGILGLLLLPFINRHYQPVPETEDTPVAVSA